MNYKKAIVFENGVTLVNDDIVTIELENKKNNRKIFIFNRKHLWKQANLC